MFSKVKNSVKQKAIVFNLNKKSNNDFYTYPILFNTFIDAIYLYPISHPRQEYYVLHPCTCSTIMISSCMSKRVRLSQADLPGDARQRGGRGQIRRTNKRAGTGTLPLILLSLVAVMAVPTKSEGNFNAVGCDCSNPTNIKGACCHHDQ